MNATTMLAQSAAKPRQQATLDGAWQFIHISPDRADGPVQVREITVPGPWQAQFDDLRLEGGIGIYRREFSIPEAWFDSRRIFLRFGAVFHLAKVFVNGEPAGTSDVGFLPFSFDVTDLLHPGVNEFKLRVDSPTEDPAEYPEAQLSDLPFGKQSWYGPLSGIWQSVFLEHCAAEHIERLRIRPDLASGRVGVFVDLHRPAGAPADIEVRIFNPDGLVAAHGSATALGETKHIELAAAVPQVRAWSPEEPCLYRAEVTVRRNGVLIDECDEAFGFRTIETRDGRFIFNGRALYLRGALDQDYYPDGICTLPSLEYAEAQFRKAKALGLNCLRCHIKAPDPRYYEAADRIGLLIWTELPNAGITNDRSRPRNDALLKGIVDRDGNHPSIICWTIINENWGVDLVHDPEHRAWLKRTYDWLKAYDPSRLVVDNSPIAPSFHIKSDIADFHYYAAFPDSRAEWDNFTQSLAGRPQWLFSPEGDAEISGNEPVLCSEFGVWGLPDPKRLRGGDGAEPWWFETGHDWGEGVMYPHGVEHRFEAWSLRRVFGSLSHFIIAAQWQQWRALKYEIEAMRRQQSLAGYVITEFTDAHWESNGLLDMRRNPRVFHDVFSSINTDTVIVPRPDRYACEPGGAVTVDLAIAHGGGGDLHGLWLEVTCGSSATIPLERLSAATVVNLEAVRVELPQVVTPTEVRASFVLRDGSGAARAANYIDISVPDTRRSDVGPLWSPQKEIADHLEALGYTVIGEAGPDALWVTSHLDPVIAAHVRAGGRLLMLPDREFLLQPLFPHWQNVMVRSREGTPWKGDWASAFSWLRRGRAFAKLPGGPLLDVSFDRVLPTHVIAGCNHQDFQARVHAGIVVGWVHRAAALVVERSYGKGRFVASTFRPFREAPGADPTATALVDCLLQLARADGAAATRAGAPVDLVAQERWNSF